MVGPTAVLLAAIVTLTFVGDKEITTPAAVQKKITDPTAELIAEAIDEYLDVPNGKIVYRESVRLVLGSTGCKLILGKKKTEVELGDQGEDYLPFLIRLYLVFEGSFCDNIIIDPPPQYVNFRIKVEAPKTDGCGTTFKLVHSNIKRLPGEIDQMIKKGLYINGCKWF